MKDLIKTLHSSQRLAEKTNLTNIWKYFPSDNRFYSFGNLKTHNQFEKPFDQTLYFQSLDQKGIDRE